MRFLTKFKPITLPGFLSFFCDFFRFFRKIFFPNITIFFCKFFFIKKKADLQLTWCISFDTFFSFFWNFLKKFKKKHQKNSEKLPFLLHAVYTLPEPLGLDFAQKCTNLCTTFYTIFPIFVWSKNFLKCQKLTAGVDLNFFR